jgi:hypothetical protein
MEFATGNTVEQDRGQLDKNVKIYICPQPVEAEDCRQNAKKNYLYLRTETLKEDKFSRPLKLHDSREQNEFSG